MAEQQTVVVTKQHADVAVAIYAGTDLAADLAGDPEMVESTAEMVAFFQRDTGYLPREAAELDAYANSADEWAAYQAAHPAPLPTVACTETPAETAAAVQQAVAQVDVDGLLKQFAKQCRRAADASLEMGRIGMEYVTARMTLSDKVTRDACTKTLVATWQESADEVVTVQRVGALIRLYAASAAFPAVEGCKKPSLRMYRAFSVLVQRDEKQRAETWAVTAGMEADAAALWTEAQAKGLSGDECEAAVVTLQKRHAEAVVQAKKLKAEQDKRDAETAAAAKRDADQKQAAAENAAKLAEQQAAAPAADADKAVLTANMEQAHADLLEAQRVKAAADQVAIDAKAKADRTELERHQAVQKQVDADAKAKAAADKKAAKSKPAVDAGPAPVAPKPPAGCGEVNLLAAAVASKGAPKDVADLIVGMVVKTTAPDDVLIGVLQALKGHKDVGKAVQRGITAFLAAVTAPTVTVPLPTAPAANGQLAVA